MPISRIAAPLVAAAIEAGQAIMTIYDAGFSVEIKSDNSPVTQADAAGEKIILAALAQVAGDIPVIAEEEVAAGRIPRTDGTFFLVDPLDGTREFVQRRGDFTVNIALVEDRQPVFGIVYAPAKGRIFVGDVRGNAAWSAPVSREGAIGRRAPIHVRDRPRDGLSVVASQSHNTPETDAYLDQFDVAERLSFGSSLKICVVAAGEADLYPRLAPTCEWDIGAGDAILRAAGGKLLAPDGAPMRYGKDRFFNPGFVAAGDIDPPPIAPFMAA
ncbi:3'(2'),5'-bisphosphate nucleotidase CysQ [Sphingobium cloacae]|uniref:3'(2'),5'-bisphosphate nucleotidase CysQ n=1 Tax=Sphingobium cloacae TaxID=120107 RepID=UPI001E61E967|nr:3'(2'),5'-bisphosphate nucleotidase CysQ [Sphingobium cloacae]